jgi:4-diphosphocytidyl-2-C-methyl-D-erythritol kinase
MQETAYAKINLALHVRARQPDGYHRIETIFAFCEDGDLLTLDPAEGEVTLTVGGPFASQLEGEGDNLVLAAARMMKWFEGFGREPFAGAALHLDKRLPIAAGLGGGSADAGAAVRLLDRYWHASGDNKELCLKAASLGADVPACIVSRTRIGTGTGADLSMPGFDDAAGLAVLLVNPGVARATGPVFRAWDRIDRGPLADGTVLEAALAGRNDLEQPALSLCPVIGDVLRHLRGTDPLLARMSGSGATCFALYRSQAERDAAAAAIRLAEPHWWMLATRLR